MDNSIQDTSKKANHFYDEKIETHIGCKVVYRDDEILTCQA